MHEVGGDLRVKVRVTKVLLAMKTGTGDELSLKMI